MPKEGPALREAAAALQARLDSAGSGEDAQTQRSTRFNTRDKRRLILSRPWDPNLPLSYRVENLRQASSATCTNLREILFGPAPDVTDVFARARRELARFPSDSAFIGLMERDAVRGPPVFELMDEASLGWVGTSVFGLVRVAGDVLGSPRLARCGIDILSGLDAVWW